MSLNNSQNGSGPQNGGRSVRFAPQVDAHHDDGPRRKRPRIDRPNEDEQDDIDDWSDDEEHVGASAKELLEAKRSRRLQRDHVEEVDEQEETHVDAATSLTADADQEDVAIEPFNMRAEENDGSGYFDGDTYVFRKRNEEDEPDAWVDSIDEQKLSAKADSSADDENEQEEDENDMDNWNREDLYSKLLPLVSDTETVLQALVRFGALLKRKTDKDDENQQAATAMARQALDTLTEASNALLLKGDVDIYQKTRNDLVKLVPKGPVVTWEYRGNQDGKVHGPYTTDQMKSWTGAGYFIGEQAVQIRTVLAASDKEEKKDDKPTVDDLLSDLMDDDEEDDGKKDAQPCKGEWVSSNDVDFTLYP